MKVNKKHTLIKILIRFHNFCKFIEQERIKSMIHTGQGKM